jgi:hypothetical protein
VEHRLPEVQTGNGKIKTVVSVVVWWVSRDGIRKQEPVLWRYSGEVVVARTSIEWGTRERWI